MKDYLAVNKKRKTIWFRWEIVITEGEYSCISGKTRIFIHGKMHVLLITPNMKVHFVFQIFKFLNFKILTFIFFVDFHGEPLYKSLAEKVSWNILIRGPWTFTICSWYDKLQLPAYLYRNSLMRTKIIEILGSPCMYQFQIIFNNLNIQF